MAEADAAHPWDGRNARAQHEHEGADAQSPYRHDHTSAGDGAGPVDGGRAAAMTDLGGYFGRRPAQPGSDGEHRLQRRLGTVDRAARFYGDQVLDHLNERMREFVQRQEMFFLATADSRGECDSSFRAGPAGFLHVVDERTLVYPEYRGNGVHASLGNIEENPHLGIMLVDFTRARIGLHINGRAAIVEDAEMRAAHPELPEDPVPGRRAQLWVRVEVEEAYIHCAKHIPHLQRAPKRTARDWGTDDYKRKGGDFFGTARDAKERRAHERAAEPVSASPSRAAGEQPAGTSAVGAPGETGAYGEQAAREREETPLPAASLYTTGPETSSAGRQEAEAAPPPAPASFTAAGDDAAAGSTADGGPEDAVAHGQPAGDASTGFFGGTSGDAAWQLPEMPPAPQLLTSTAPYGDAGQAGGGALSGSSPSWPSSAAPSGDAYTSGVNGAAGYHGGVAPGGYGDPAAGQYGEPDPETWRLEAERALAEAQRRGSAGEAGSFQGWFG